MRTRPLIVASMTALLTFAASAPALAQTQSNGDQSVPDAPQPQKKPAAKPQSSDSGSQAKDKSKSEPQASDSSSPPNDKTAPKQPPSTKDENPFPEAVSKDAAAKAAADSSGSDHPSDSEKDKTAPKPPPSTKDANPFPEAVSRDAAKASGNDPDQAPAAKSDLPPGVSSSQSSGGPDGGENEAEGPQPGG